MAGDKDEFAGLISQIDDRMKKQKSEILDTVSKMIAPTMPTHEGHTTTNIPSLHYGEFKHMQLGDTMEQTYCPECGRAENTSIRVKEVPKIEIQEKIPTGYQKVASAKDAFDIVRKGHADGKAWYECDNCKAGVLDFLDTEGEALKTLGWEVKPVKKK